MKADLLNKIVDKAKTKDNGVYTLSGIVYRVRNNGVTHIIENRQIFQCCGHFITSISGEYESLAVAVKTLKNL